MSNLLTNIFSKLFDNKEDEEESIKYYKNDYEEYIDMKRGEFIEYDSPLEEFVSVKEIYGILDKDKEYFWNHHSYCKEDYMDLTKRMSDGDSEATDNFYYHPIKIFKFKSIYILESDGRHRVCAAQELDIKIKVLITGEYIKIE